MSTAFKTFQSCFKLNKLVVIVIYNLEPLPVRLQHLNYFCIIQLNYIFILVLSSLSNKKFLNCALSKKN